MGCASSKQSHRRCRHCGRSPSPLPRSYSVPSHQPSPGRRESYQVVALTSHTLGSLKLDYSNHPYQDAYNATSTENYIINDKNYNKDSIIVNGNGNINRKDIDDAIYDDNCKSMDFATGITKAKTWSEMINTKIPKIMPKTPTRTPPGEPETINTWELMEGLEDASPLRLPHLVDRSFSFHAVPNKTDSPDVSRSTKLQENGKTSPKPLWLQLSEDANSDSNSNSVISDFDPEIISTFRKALEELSPTDPFDLRLPEPEKKTSSFHNRQLLLSDGKVVTATGGCPPGGGGGDKVVVYFTSLRGVRKTYEDCCHVRVILKGFGVRVDERDVSMHYGFREELKELLGDGFEGGLPRVFVKGRYIGGVDEVRQMHDDGVLEKILQDCEVVGDDGGGGVCEACGDIRFVPCERWGGRRM
uniref:Glutaredoxin domain-containing protein n=1 Tax=Nelumbo nucifera TaxID=4432 RepID=A0A822YRR2_NELNU|nr:TPA_asm: hypothetical protein HUJ06_005463 [Nelumbo nucifera]